VTHTARDGRGVGGPSFPTYADLRARPGDLTGTAWGVFGHDDQLGTLNHLTAERVKAAAASIREGLRFNLNLPLQAFDPPLISHRGSIKHEVFGLNEFHRDDRVDNLFTQASTQIDSLRHFAHPDYGFYNGVSGDEITVGTTALGIQHVAERTIAGRGVLVDLARFRRVSGRSIDHAASEQIGVTEIVDALESQGSSLLPGDILLLRFGWLEYYRRGEPSDRGPLTSAGLAQTEETAAWLWDSQVSMVATDNIALEAWPASGSSLTTRAEEEGRLERSSHTGMLHRILIGLLGVTIGELWDLEQLAAACAIRARYDAFVVAEPLNLIGGVGSPANAVAII
jgi:kynurenine formamidase